MNTSGIGIDAFGPLHLNRYIVYNVFFTVENRWLRTEQLGLTTCKDPSLKTEYELWRTYNTPKRQYTLCINLGFRRSVHVVHAADASLISSAYTIGVHAKAMETDNREEAGHPLHQGSSRRWHWELHLWITVWKLCGAEDHRTVCHR